MAKSLDLLLTLLPFEPECFAGSGLQADYVGHPLTETIGSFVPDPGFRQRFGFEPGDKVLSLFPGSRKQEVERNLPIMLKVAERLKKLDPKLKVTICSAHPSVQGDIPVSENYNLMRESHLALAKSGTVVLELALHKTPTVVPYAIKPLDVFIATKIFRISLPFYSMPNIILQKRVFPELFGPNLTEESLFQAASRLWQNEDERRACIAGCAELWDVLEKTNAFAIAAEKIKKLL
jgi:lipid-A-disaccharide synthase